MKTLNELKKNLQKEEIKLNLMYDDDSLGDTDIWEQQYIIDEIKNKIANIENKS